MDHNIESVNVNLESESLLDILVANGSWLLSTWWFDNMTVVIDAMYDAQTGLADEIRGALEE